MKKIFLITFLAFAIQAAQHTCPTIEFQAVSDTVTAANAGDTINLPADTATWTDNLVITKGLTLIGTDTTTSMIVSGYTASEPSVTWSSNNYLISYVPANPAANQRFELRGVKIDCDSTCGGIYIDNPTSTAINKIRIDSCMVTKAYNSGGTMRGIMVRGTVYGVVDKCLFSLNKKCIDVYGNNRSSWDSLTYDFGTANAFYYENNTFVIYDSPHSGGAGGKYVARYNTYTYTGSAKLSPWYDVHGNQGTGQNYATMAAEIYKNEITFSDNTKGCLIADHRGGKALIWNNTVSNSGSDVTINVREEYADSLNATTAKQPQHVSESYYWDNKRGTTPVSATETSDCCDSIVVNEEFFNKDTAYTPYTYPHPLRGGSTPPSGAGTVVNADGTQVYATAGIPSRDSAAAESAGTKYYFTAGIFGGDSLKGDTVVVAPIVMVNPATAARLTGETITFTVTATGTAPLTYQWQLDGLVVGGDSASYPTAALTLADSGAVVRVIVSNAAGADTSDNAVIVVKQAPAITTNPRDTTVTQGQQYSMSVTASGSGSLTYAWTKNALPVGTTATITGTAGLPDNNAVFVCRVTNDTGEVQSNPGVLTVNELPVFGPFTYNGGAPVTCTTGIAYVIPILNVGPGTADSFTLKNQLPTGLALNRTTGTISGTPTVETLLSPYFVYGWQLGTKIDSALAMITVLAPAQITVQPRAVKKALGKTATFSVRATGTPLITYQWQVDSVDIIGAMDSNYTTDVLDSADDSTTYRCIVSNPAGADTSNTVRLTIGSAIQKLFFFFKRRR